MKKFKHTVKNKLDYYIKVFYLTRPYSWTHVILGGYLAAMLAGQNTITALLIGAVDSLVLWCLANILLEFVHRDTGRPRFNVGLIVVLAISAFVIAMNSVYSLVFVTLFVFVSYLYTLKKRLPWGLFSFLLRGLTALLQFFSVYFLFTQTVSSEAALFSLILFCLISARNLIGDLRDLPSDKTTFPAKFGKRNSVTISLILAIFSIIFTLCIKSYSVIILVLLIPMLLLIKDRLLLHRVGIVLTTSFFSVFIVSMNFNYLFLLAIPLDILFNIFFYNKIFRKVNPITKT